MLDNRTDINKWLTKHLITHYKIAPDLTVDVNNSVDLSDQKLTELPVQFGIIQGNFRISKNQLTSLKGCPHKVEATFDFSDNQIESLEFGPQFVGRDYLGLCNKIKSLEYMAKTINGSINLSWNQIESLYGIPDSVRWLDLRNNLITSLEGLTHTQIKGNLYLEFNPLNTFAYLPEDLVGFINLRHDSVRVPGFEDFYSQELAEESPKYVFREKLATIKSLLLHAKLQEIILDKSEETFHRRPTKI